MIHIIIEKKRQLPVKSGMLEIKIMIPFICASYIEYPFITFSRNLKFTYRYLILQRLSWCFANYSALVNECIVMFILVSYYALMIQVS